VIFDVDIEALKLCSQAINDIEIGSGGKWRGMTLIPWGPVYKVSAHMHVIFLGYSLCLGRQGIGIHGNRKNSFAKVCVCSSVFLNN
jgi:hypothetical protein